MGLRAAMSDISSNQKEEIETVVKDAIKSQLRVELDLVVLKTVSGILTGFGINDDDRSEFRSDLAYLRRWRHTSENITRGSWIAIMTLLVSGVASAIWLGVKATLLLVKGT